MYIPKFIIGFIAGIIFTVVALSIISSKLNKK